MLLLECNSYVKAAAALPGRIHGFSFRSLQTTRSSLCDDLHRWSIMSYSTSPAYCATLLCRFGILLLAASPASGSRIMRRSQLALLLGPDGLGPSHNQTLVARDQGINTAMSTCGYLNGDPSRPRTANSGYDCRVDAANQLWGFCPTTVIAASDCGLAGSCIDQYKCSSGCGAAGKTQLTTFTW